MPSCNNMSLWKQMRQTNHNLTPRQDIKSHCTISHKVHYIFFPKRKWITYANSLLKDLLPFFMPDIRPYKQVKDKHVPQFSKQGKKEVVTDPHNFYHRESNMKDQSTYIFARTLICWYLWRPEHSLEVKLLLPSLKFLS